MTFHSNALDWYSFYVMPNRQVLTHSSFRCLFERNAHLNTLENFCEQKAIPYCRQTSFFFCRVLHKIKFINPWQHFAIKRELVHCGSMETRAVQKTKNPRGRPKKRDTYCPADKMEDREIVSRNVAGMFESCIRNRMCTHLSSRKYLIGLFYSCSGGNETGEHNMSISSTENEMRSAEGMIPTTKNICSIFWLEKTIHKCTENSVMLLFDSWSRCRRPRYVGCRRLSCSEK